MGIGLSFTEFKTVTNAKFVGLQNYIAVFKGSDEFISSLIFTVGFSVVTVIAVNLLAFFLALTLIRKFKLRNFFRTVFFMPNLIGGIVLGYIFQLIINGVLLNYGYTITSNWSFGFWGLVVLSLWQMTGYMMVIYIAGLTSIPFELYEAAKVDGASGFRTLISITLPSVMPSITVCLFLTITNSFKMFDQNLALTAGAPSGQTEMLALDIYNTFYGRTGGEGIGQAKAVIFFLIVAVISFIQLRLTRSKEYDS
jgi:raffinose/stachyose/melibiose transport system permease protein